MSDSDPSEPTKAYYVTYSVREEVTALVYANSGKEAVEKFRNGGEEWVQASGEAQANGVKGVRRAPKEDRVA